jgi:hypothetical protein
MTMRWMLVMVLLGSTPAAFAAPMCVGDCDGRGTVTTDELVRGVDIALGSRPADQCQGLGGEPDGNVGVDRLLDAVGNALDGCPTFVGEFFGTVDLEADQSATMNLTVETAGNATAMIVISERAGLGAFLTGGGAAPLGSFSITGTVDLDSGAYDLNGSFNANGADHPVNAAGVLPLRGTGGTFAFEVDSRTFAGSIVPGDGSTPTPTRTSVQLATPTPTATPTGSGSTPTPPSGGCADGIFELTLSNRSGDSNLVASAASLGKLTALDVLDTTGNSYVWTITTSRCDIALGEVNYLAMISASGIPTRIQPGTYLLNSSTPPFLAIGFTESRFNPLDPGGNFNRPWASTGGTLVIEDGGGGSLSVRAAGVPMGPHPLLRGGTGTFTLDLNGVITRVMH